MTLARTKPVTGAVVQARTCSTRLPGKVLLPLLDGLTVLQYLHGRLSRCANLDKVVIATTNKPCDDRLAGHAAAMGALVTRGDENDCLQRTLQAVREHGIDVVARVTSDCPLVLPGVLDAMLGYYLANRDRLDYLSNREFTDFPEGVDVEVFGSWMLEEAQAGTQSPRDREHINYFFLDRPQRYRIRYYNHATGRDFSRFKLSIDTEDDLRQGRRLFEVHGLRPDFGMADLFAALERMEAREGDPT